MLQRLRLPVEIRGFPGTRIFLCRQQLGLQLGLTYSLPKPVPLTYLKKCQKYVKLLYILSLLLQEIFFCRKTRTTRKKMLVVHQKQSKNVLLHVLTNLKTCNSVNPRFVAFLRLPLRIQKYLLAYYTIYYNFSFAIHKNCTYYSLRIGMKDSLNETILFLLHNMILPCWKMRNPSAGTR